MELKKQLQNPEILLRTPYSYTWFGFNLKLLLKYFVSLSKVRSKGLRLWKEKFKKPIQNQQTVNIKIKIYNTY